MGWLGGMGESVVDPVNQVGQSATVHGDGSVSAVGGVNPCSGYSLVSADSMEAATELARGWPILHAGGSMEVH